MAKKKPSAVENGKAATPPTLARSYHIARGDLKSGPEFANLLSALISDVVLGKLAPPVLTATCNGVGKLLKMVELQHKYGGNKPLRLS